MIRLMVDIEGAEHKEIDINGRRGEMVKQNGGIVIVFSNSEYTFKLMTDVGDDEAIKIVESIFEIK